MNISHVLGLAVSDSVNVFVSEKLVGILMNSHISKLILVGSCFRKGDGWFSEFSFFRNGDGLFDESQCFRNGDGWFGLVLL